MKFHKAQFRQQCQSPLRFFFPKSTATQHVALYNITASHCKDIKLNLLQSLLIKSDPVCFYILYNLTARWKAQLSTWDHGVGHLSSRGSSTNIWVGVCVLVLRYGLPMWRRFPRAVGCLLYTAHSLRSCFYFNTNTWDKRTREHSKGALPTAFFIHPSPLRVTV